MTVSERVDSRVSRVGVAIALCGVILSLMLLNHGIGKLRHSLDERAGAAESYETMYRQLRAAAIDDRLVGKLEHDSKTVSALMDQMDANSTESVLHAAEYTFNTYGVITYSSCAIMLVITLCLLVVPSGRDSYRCMLIANAFYVASSLCLIVGIGSAAVHLLQLGH